MNPLDVAPTDTVAVGPTTDRSPACPSPGTSPGAPALGGWGTHGEDGGPEGLAEVLTGRHGLSPFVQVFVVGAHDGERAVVDLRGEIDIASSGYLRATLAHLVDAGHVDIIADLTKVVSISSSGLGVLVGALKTVRSRGGRLQLVAAGTSLLRILRITRLNQVFTVHPTLDVALRH